MVQNQPQKVSKWVRHNQVSWSSFKEILNLEGHQNRIAGSRVTAILHNGWIFPIGQRGEASQWRVCYQRGLTRLVFVFSGLCIFLFEFFYLVYCIFLLFLYSSFCTLYLDYVYFLQFSIFYIMYLLYSVFTESAPRLCPFMSCGSWVSPLRWRPEQRELETSGQ